MGLGSLSEGMHATQSHEHSAHSQVRRSRAKRRASVRPPSCPADSSQAAAYDQLTRECELLRRFIKDRGSLSAAQQLECREILALGIREAKQPERS
eukprot:m.115381 g.115381  ORF g.115381 m.115381 type:complete len:96 (+) comp9169_c0_seq6:698-985(+)